MQFLLLLVVLLSAGPVAVKPPQIQRFRAAAGLTPFSPLKLEALNAPTLNWAGVEAAHDLLSRVNPKLDVTPSPFDTPQIAELKSVIAEAKEVVAASSAIEKLGQFEAWVARGGKDFDKHALDDLYFGQSFSGIPTNTSGERLRHLIKDGAPKQALKLAKQLKLPYPQLKAISELPQGAVVSAIELGLMRIRSLVAQKRWGEAWEAAWQLRDEVFASGLRAGSVMYYSLEAVFLSSEAENKGSDRIYGNRADKTKERVRVQDHSDCAVQQLYNHPVLAGVAAAVPYHDFLRAVEKIVGDRIRSHGMHDYQGNTVLKRLGYEKIHLRMPGRAEELREQLAKHGPLLATIRWIKSGERRENLHAVLIREFKDGRFVVIDSNHKRPQLLTFGELGVLGLNAVSAVERLPMPWLDHKALLAAFIADVPPPAPLWRRFLGLD